MSLLVDSITGAVVGADGGGNRPIRQGRQGSQVVSDGHGKYYEPASRAQLYVAQGTVTTPVSYTVIATIGGPLLWNGSTKFNAGIVAVGWTITTADTTTTFALGLTGSGGQSSAPSATTAIDATGNCYLGGIPSNCTAYRTGTVVNAGRFLLPFAHVHTGALSLDTSIAGYVEFSSMLVVPPQSWAAVAASAQGTAVVMTISLMWEEVPV